MPFYSVQHAQPLNAQQQDELADAITSIHSTLFTTPKIFVNVAFQDIGGHPRYVGGKRKSATMLSAHVRHGPSRTPEHYAELIRQLQAAWAKIVPDSKLDRVAVIGGIVAAMEAGIMLPPAGGDKEWIAENWQTFNERAEAGDEEMQDIVADVKARGLIGDGKTAQQRLEEALGWGDAA